MEPCDDWNPMMWNSRALWRLTPFASPVSTRPRSRHSLPLLRWTSLHARPSTRSTSAPIHPFFINLTNRTGKAAKHFRRLYPPTSVTCECELFPAYGRPTGRLPIVHSRC